MLNLDRIFAASRFVSAARERDPARFEQWRNTGLFENAPDADALRREILDGAAAGATEAEFMRALRELRLREMVRVTVRDLCGLAQLDQTLAHLSDLADACCEAALRFAGAQLQQRYGTPRDEQGREVRAVVLGMGKLGGRELNFSSDIDLIWAYTTAGSTDGERPISNEEFFGKLAQDAGRILSTQTQDGFVFRVDTLLRPFGSAGALAWSFEALENYYQEHGREWERYALIKARPVAGDLAGGERLLKSLQPFVYRRYLDFNAIGSLRELKRMIAEEVGRKGQRDNVKLGAGGIRELEFIVQAFQLVRGGQDPRLRDNRLRPVLRYLGEAGHLPQQTAAQLDECYVFLRRLENAIQMYADQQTHALPVAEDARAALCIALDFTGWSALAARLREVRDFVQQEFERVFREPPREAAGSPLSRAVTSLWDGAQDAATTAEVLRGLGFPEAPEEVCTALLALRDARMVRGLGEPALRRLTALVPMLLAECVQETQPDIAAKRVLDVVQAIAGRSTYLALLRDNAIARRHLTRLCSASPWMTQMLARSPMLLDQLLDPRTLYAPPQRDELQTELGELCSHLHPGDTEAGMDLLRRFRQENMLRIAACDLAGQLPLRKVCDHLTWLAETVLTRALELAWVELRARHGEPAQPAFAIVAYGKFGGIELGYGSDLDLVFVFDGDADAQTQGGPRTITAGEFYAKLAQRVIHWLSTQTPAGRAYEVDMELRPSGASGLLVSSLKGFRDYQLQQAWTWEHQALARARAVAGHASLREGFERVRVEALTRARAAAALRREVLEMRARMHQHLEKHSPGRFDLKQGSGGMTDLEFITQFLVLREAARLPALVEWPDNRRQLEALARASVIKPEEEIRLVEIYDAYRAWFHSQDLQQADHLAEDELFRPERSDIQALWQKYLLDA